MSEPQTPISLIFRRICPGPGAGRGTSRMITLPGCSSTACFMISPRLPSCRRASGPASRGRTDGERTPGERGGVTPRRDTAPLPRYSVLIRTGHRRLRPVLPMLFLLLGAAAAGTQADEHAYFTDF